jgi:hypothetical protein
MSFIAFNTEIINRLKTGSIKNVALFGDSFDRKAPPYAVVKPIAGEDRKLLQIFVHASLGMQDTLEAYIFQELPALLKEPLEKDGKRTTVFSTGAWLGPYVDEGDNTLAMSRDFYVPVII